MDERMIPIAAVLETIDEIRQEFTDDRCEDGVADAVVAVLDELAGLADLAVPTIKVSGLAETAERIAAELDRRTEAQREADAVEVWNAAYDLTAPARPQTNVDNLRDVANLLAEWIAADEGRLAAFRRDHEEAGR